MAVTVTDNRTPWDAADSTTGWTGTTLTLVTADPDPVEATGHLGNVVSTATVDCYFTGSVDLTNKLVYAWALPLGAMDTLANGGVAILIGDGTDRVGYHLAGSDRAVFRHNSGQPVYQCLVWDEASRPATTTVRAGVLANLTITAVTQIGVMFKTLAKSKGAVANCFVDIIRILDPSLNNGCALTVSGGTSGDPGTFTQIATEDSSTADVKAHGIVRLLGAGAIGLQGPLRFGDQASASSWFEDKNVTVVFEDRGLAASRYKLFISDNGTGTTTFKLGTKVGSGVTATGADGVTITGGSNVNWQFDASTDTDVTDVFIYGSTFNRATQGVSFRSGHEFIGGIISASGVIDLNGATFVNNAVVSSTVATDASALVWNVNTNPDGYLDGTSFTKGTNNHHAIQFGASAPATVTLRGLTFTSFSGSDGADGSVILLADTGGDRAWTINTVGVSGAVSVKKTRSGDTYTVVADPVTALVNVKNSSGTNIQDARVFVKASDGTGPFPFEESVTISNSGAVATVTHTGHGMATNDKVVISGASHEANNGVHTITFIDVNSYSYTMGSSPGSNPTGTIISTFVAISGTTDASGNISMSRVFSADQPIVGWARKATSAPFYKTGPIAGSIDSATGFSANVQLVLDE